MRVEQEQKVTEDARIYAEQEAVAKKYAAQVLQVMICPFWLGTFASTSLQLLKPPSTAGPL